MGLQTRAREVELQDVCGSEFVGGVPVDDAKFFVGNNLARLLPSGRFWVSDNPPKIDRQNTLEEIPVGVEEPRFITAVAMDEFTEVSSRVFDAGFNPGAYTYFMALFAGDIFNGGQHVGGPTKDIRSTFRAWISFG